MEKSRSLNKEQKKNKETPHLTIQLLPEFHYIAYSDRTGWSLSLKILTIETSGDPFLGRAVLGKYDASCTNSRDIPNIDF